MDPLRNPFVPGAGTPPPTLAGRDDILDRIHLTLARVKTGRPAKSLMLVGLRGVGKTVLLAKAQDYAKKNDYICDFIEVQEENNLENLLVRSLRSVLLSLDKIEKAKDIGRQALRTLASFAGAFKARIGDISFSFNLDPERGSADSGNLEYDIADLFEAVGNAAKQKDTAIALVIDELQLLDKFEMRALIMAMHRVQQKNLPIVLIGGGLPQLRSLAGKAKSYAERLFDYPEIGSLGKDDAAQALVEPIEAEGCSIDGNAVNQIIAKTEGYPYFLQAWGHHTWDYAKSSPITENDVSIAHQIAEKNLDESFFQVRMDRLSDSEKGYLFAMAKLEPKLRQSGKIAAQMNRTVERVAPLRSALLKKGMIYSPKRGDTKFTVPLFDEYLRRFQANAP